MAKNISTKYDDIFDALTYEDEGNGGNPRCDWSWWVCQETPTHSLVTGHELENRNAEFYCTRHLVLTVRHLHDVHSKTCPKPFEKHIFSYTEI